MRPTLRFLPIALVLMAGCTTTIRDVDKTRPLLPASDQEEVEGKDALRPSMFLRSYSAQIGEMTKPVRVRGAPLYQVIEIAAPGYTLTPTDAYVNLYKPVTLTTDGLPLPKLLDTLSSITGYDLHASGKTIQAAAYVSRQWSLPMFSVESDTRASVAGATSGGSSSGGGMGGGGGGASGGGGGNRTISSALNNKVDDWKDIVKQVETLMGASAGTAAVPSVDSAGNPAEGQLATPPTVPQVVANRSLGYLRVYGEAAKVRAVDSYISSLVKDARKQVRLDVRAIEVSFKDSKSRGINWNAAINTIFNDALGRAGITLGADYTVPGAATDGVFSLGAQATNADDSIEAMLKFLSSYGNVELRNNPQVTVFNGRTAYIGSGEEFGYIASVEQTVSNGTVVSTPQISRILIGVELAITPRVLDDDKILLEVVPIISTFRGFDNFTIGNSQFSQPRIVLNQLATQVITSSGRTVHLGGLITSRLEEATRGLPLEHGALLQKILSPVFSGESNALERRELMLVVTPYLSNP